MPKASYFLGHWKIGQPWKNVLQYKTSLEVMKPPRWKGVTLTELTTYFHYFVTCYGADGLYSCCTGTANQQALITFFLFFWVEFCRVDCNLTNTNALLLCDSHSLFYEVKLPESYFPFLLVWCCCVSFESACMFCLKVEVKVCDIDTQQSAPLADCNTE